jgi:hypothetical protein
MSKIRDSKSGIPCPLTSDLRPLTYWLASTYRGQRLLELLRAAVGAVLLQHPSAGGVTDPLELMLRQLERLQRFLGSARDKYLPTRFEELIQPLPPVT